MDLVLASHHLAPDSLAPRLRGGRGDRRVDPAGVRGLILVMGLPYNMLRGLKMTRSQQVAWCVTLLCMVGCGDSTGPDAIAGRYNLRSVNGEALPVVLIQVLDVTIEITDGHVQLSSSGTCSSSFTWVTSEGSVSDTEFEADTCTWTSTNDVAVVFSWSDGTTDTGSLSGNTLTVADEGVVYVFSR
jgi:hypothetical protein